MIAVPNLDGSGQRICIVCQSPLSAVLARLGSLCCIGCRTRPETIVRPS